MQKTYAWINKDGNEVKFTANVIYRYGIEIGFSVTVAGITVSCSPFRYDITNPIRFHGQGKYVSVSLPEDVEADLKQLTLDTFMASDIRLSVCDTTSYGIDNGISHSDFHFLCKAFSLAGALSDSAVWKMEKSINSRFGIDGPVFNPVGDVRYVPNPVHSYWREDYKQAHIEAAKKMRADGHILVSASELVSAFWSAAAECAIPSIREEIASNERKIAQCTGLTNAQARAAETAYNNINNEGGDGYVPHYVGIEERDYYLRRNSYLSASIENIYANRR